MGRLGRMVRRAAHEQVDTELVPDPRHATQARLARATAVRHTQKRKRRNNGTTVEFNPAELKKFVTGFRKRKLERKERAKKRIEECEKKTKRIKRKEREQQLKLQCGMGRHDKWASSSESEAEKSTEAKRTEVYTTSDFKTVVHIQPVRLDASNSCVSR